MKKIILLLILSLTMVMASFLISVEEGAEIGTLTLETAQQTDSSLEVNYKDAPFLSVIPGLYTFGTETRGAYGGKVDPKILHVNTLDGGVSNTDSTHGSFYWALKQTFPRIIVFDVSGEIYDTRPEEGGYKPSYDIGSPYVHVAGQTAPAPGISLRNVGIRSYTHDVVFQHIRFRKGDEVWESSSGYNVRASNDDGYNNIIDHCSFAWGVDKHVALWGATGHGITNFTMSNCLTGEHLDYSINPKGHHPTDILIGPDCTNVAIVNNLQISTGWRHPYVHAGSETVVYNNLIYNPQYQLAQFRTQTGETRSTKMNFESNVVIIGEGKALTDRKMLHGSTSLVQDCYIKLGRNSNDGVITDLWNDLVYDPNNKMHKVDEAGAIPTPHFSPFPVEDTYDYLIANAGARPALRSEDYTDTRIVNTLINRTGQMIDCVGIDTNPQDSYNNNCAKNAGGWPKIIGQTKKFIPVSNPHTLHSNDTGYTNLEVQLHALAKYVEKGQ